MAPETGAAFFHSVAEGAVGFWAGAAGHGTGTRDNGVFGAVAAGRTGGGEDATEARDEARPAMYDKLQNMPAAKTATTRTAVSCLGPSTRAKPPLGDSGWSVEDSSVSTSVNISVFASAGTDGRNLVYHFTVCVIGSTL